MKTSGIYKITNFVTNKVYIGSSKNIPRRWAYHKTGLKHNKHANPHLQDSYNRYGDTFSYEVVLYCDERDLLLFEQRCLDVYWDGGVQCYNISKDALAPMSGRKYSEATKLRYSIERKGKQKSEEARENIAIGQIGHTLSAESRQKISDANSGSNHPRFGKTISDQNRLSLTLAVQGMASYAAKLTDDQVREIFISEEPGVALAKKYGISPSIVCCIRKGKRWKHVTQRRKR